MDMQSMSVLLIDIGFEESPEYQAFVDSNFSRVETIQTNLLYTVIAFDLKTLKKQCIFQSDKNFDPHQDGSDGLNDWYSPLMNSFKVCPIRPKWRDTVQFGSQLSYFLSFRIGALAYDGNTLPTLIISFSQDKRDILRRMQFFMDEHIHSMGGSLISISTYPPLDENSNSDNADTQM